jgi:hypothetical protein
MAAIAKELKAPVGTKYDKDLSVPQPDADDIFEKAVLLVLSIQYGFGLKKKISKDAVQTEADEEWIEGYKKTLKSPEFDAIKTADAKLRAFVDTRCLPSLSKLFKSGIYPLPLELLPEVDDAIESHRLKRDLLIEKFLETYEQRCGEAKEGLGGLWSQKDYPSTQELRNGIELRAQYVTINTPTSLKGISQAIFQREAQKTEAMWKEAKDEIRNALRVQLQEMLDHMVDRLGGSIDGKTKKFRASMVDKYTDFLKTFSAKNIANDSELDEIVGKLKDISEGLDPEDLRKNDDYRTKLVEKFAEAKAHLDLMIVDKPSRMFSMEDE